ncbi:MAG TPA: radical SAM protein, partial [Crocinitomicaceae bacterium]|nr:radical SAM protein [Crocinitomicaceae bacterium]
LVILEGKIKEYSPDLIAFTIPFPGNLFSALRCSQFIKHYYPTIKVAIGGGYCNTELRELEDVRIFNYVDFISLDSGEVPLLKITEFVSGAITVGQLERTYILENNRVVYKNNLPNTFVHHRDLPAPSYGGLKNDHYLSFLDVMNPMHRLWTDGRWNKLTISNGCYWKKCTFCDVNLDYISNYQNTTAKDLVNKIKSIVAETGVTGFHFVDEAAPPKILKALAEELILQNVHITWWTNIRFEKTFNNELCELLAKSGCIAVTGGLEVASDRLLKKIKKGVDIAQVARVTKSFSNFGIMTHAYLMYGFPTQTEQETIDSLEIVRQLFETGCIQSAFWHQFTTTVHSPIGKAPQDFDIEITGPQFEGFAKNDLYHEDPSGAAHHLYKEGLNLALNNYLNGVGLDEEMQTWFDFEIPETSHEKGCIANYIMG